MLCISPIRKMLNILSSFRIAKIYILSSCIIHFEVMSAWMDTVSKVTLEKYHSKKDTDSIFMSKSNVCDMLLELVWDNRDDMVSFFYALRPTYHSKIASVRWCKESIYTFFLTLPSLFSLVILSCHIAYNIITSSWPKFAMQRVDGSPRRSGIKSREKKDSKYSVLGSVYPLWLISYVSKYHFYLF